MERCGFGGATGVHNWPAWEGNRSKPQARAGVIQSGLSWRNSAGLRPPTSVLIQCRFLHASPSSVCTSRSEIRARTTGDFAQTGFLASFQLFEKKKREELWFCSGALCWREESEEEHLPRC